MKFTIRDLFLVTVIVALAVGWWVDRSRLADRAQMAENMSKGFEVLLDTLAPKWRSLKPEDVPWVVPDSTTLAPKSAND